MKSILIKDDVSLSILYKVIDFRVEVIDPVEGSHPAFRKTPWVLEMNINFQRLVGQINW